MTNTNQSTLNRTIECAVNVVTGIAVVGVVAPFVALLVAVLLAPFFP